MGFDFESQLQAIADIHDASIFSWADEDAIAGSGKLLQQGTRIFVAAMLRPHHPKHAQFGPIRVATQTTDNFLIFLRFNTFRGDFRWGEGRCHDQYSVKPFEFYRSWVSEAGSQD